jgi:hypothetical protein
MAMRLGQMLRLWARLIGVTWGAAAFAAAGQLGVVYGLAIVRWDRTYSGGTEDDWQAQLAWLAWCVALAAVVGACVGARTAGRMKLELPIFAKIGVCLVAGIGAASTLPLIFLPARNTHPPINVNPQLVLIITAVAAAIIGAVVAVFALVSRQFAGGITATAGWVWAFAIFSVWWMIRRHDVQPLPRLGVLEVSQLNFSQLEWVPIAITVIVAGSVAAVARFGGGRPMHVAVSGFGGPMLLATAYLVAGPGGGELRYHTIAYRSVLVAAVLSLLVSELVAFIGRMPKRAPRDKTPREPREKAPREPSLKPVPAHETDYVGWLNELQPGQGGDDDTDIGLTPRKKKTPKQGGRHSRKDAGTGGSDADTTASLKPITDPSIYPTPSSSATESKPSAGKPSAGKSAGGPIGQPR